MSSPQAAQPRSQPTLIRGLSLSDSVLLLVGGIIGSAIFLTAKDIANAVHSPALFLGVWIAGGIISMLACFAFAELGAMYPQAGGPYLYLREAYGDLVAFLYGWMIFTVNNSGTVAALSVGFAAYFSVIVPAIGQQHVILQWGSWSLTRMHVVALATNALLTWVNVVGLRRAAVLQNIATWMKFMAIAAFILLGFLIGRGSWTHFSPAAQSAGATAAGSWPWISGIGVALIAVFWAYDGWVYLGWAAGEVKNPQRNIPRGLVIGVAIVAAIYVSMNAVYLYGIDLNSIATGESTTARAAAETLFSPAAGRWLAALIALSSFGALSACVLAGARVYYAMAQDGLFFRRMAEVHPRWRTPAFSLVVQAIWGGILTLSGRYDQLYTYIMFMGVVSYALSVLALFILRYKRPDAERPYRCTGYPWVPGLYLIISAAWALNTLWQRPTESLWGIVIVLLGIPGYLYWKWAKRRRPAATEEAPLPQL
jgi:APA family basic amino acid/polyamine antiporter